VARGNAREKRGEEREGRAPRKKSRARSSRSISLKRTFFGCGRIDAPRNGCSRKYSVMALVFSIQSGGREWRAKLPMMMLPLSSVLSPERLDVAASSNALGPLACAMRPMRC
jgi:hypothetical protein